MHIEALEACSAINWSLCFASQNHRMVVWTGSVNLFFLLRSSRNSVKPQSEAVLTKATDLKPPDSLPPHSVSERNSSSKLNTSMPAAATTPAAVQAPKTTSQSKGHALKQKVVKEEKPEESDSDQEGPIATQMLSFVMDDPDFESEESDSQRKKMVNNMQESPCTAAVLRHLTEQSFHLLCQSLSSSHSKSGAKQPEEIDLSTNPLTL